MSHPQTKGRQILHMQHTTYINSSAMSGHIIKRVCFISLPDFNTY